ncbi:hypothetical protein HIJ39_23430 [Sulfobacillus sp. DSM 109850]|uniref:Uncharacterized protein n=2 Tax=Sulfobacillus harzensis TaxID=2729629 RepID=A0A7Y0LA42_9FIRM|nr:hypothetical protein [Sulfobacillus harzensis]
MSEDRLTIEWHDDGLALWVRAWVKGVQPLDRFRARLRDSYYLIKEVGIAVEDIDHAEVRKGYGRYVPHQHVIIGDQPGRGAFPVTWAEWEM